MGSNYSNHGSSSNHGTTGYQDKNKLSKHHVTPLSTYLIVASALVVLTVLTVVASRLHLGAGVAFLIASIKASLVLLWFMHLKYDNMMNRVIFGLGFFFLALFFSFSALDVFTRIIEKSTL